MGNLVPKFRVWPLLAQIPDKDLQNGVQEQLIEILENFDTYDELPAKIKKSKQDWINLLHRQSGLRGEALAVQTQIHMYKFGLLTLTQIDELGLINLADMKDQGVIKAKTKLTEYDQALIALHRSKRNLSSHTSTSSTSNVAAPISTPVTTTSSTHTPTSSPAKPNIPTTHPSPSTSGTIIAPPILPGPAPRLQTQTPHPTNNTPSALTPTATTSNANASMPTPVTAPTNSNTSTSCSTQSGTAAINPHSLPAKPTNSATPPPTQTHHTSVTSTPAIHTPPLASSIAPQTTLPTKIAAYFTVAPKNPVIAQKPQVDDSYGDQENEDELYNPDYFDSSKNQLILDEIRWHTARAINAYSSFLKSVSKITTLLAPDDEVAPDSLSLENKNQKNSVPLTTVKPNKSFSSPPPKILKEMKKLPPPPLPQLDQVLEELAINNKELMNVLGCLAKKAAISYRQRHIELALEMWRYAKTEIVKALFSQNQNTLALELWKQNTPFNAIIELTHFTPNTALTTETPKQPIRTRSHSFSFSSTNPLGESPDPLEPDKSFSSPPPKILKEMKKLPPPPLPQLDQVLKELAINNKELMNVFDYLVQKAAILYQQRHVDFAVEMWRYAKTKIVKALFSQNQNTLALELRKQNTPFNAIIELTNFTPNTALTTEMPNQPSRERSHSFS